MSQSKEKAYRKITHELIQLSLDSMLPEEQEGQKTLYQEPRVRLVEFLQRGNVYGEVEITPEDETFLKTVPNLELIKNPNQLEGLAVILLIDEDMKLHVKTVCSSVYPRKIVEKQCMILTPAYIDHFLETSFTTSLLYLEDGLETLKAEIIQEAKLNLRQQGGSIRKDTLASEYKAVWKDSILEFFMVFAAETSYLAKLYAQGTGDNFRRSYKRRLIAWEEQTREENQLTSDPKFWIKNHSWDSPTADPFQETIELIFKQFEEDWILEEIATADKELFQAKSKGINLDFLKQYSIPQVPGAEIEMTLRACGYSPKKQKSTVRTAYERLTNFLISSDQAPKDECSKFWNLEEIISDKAIFSVLQPQEKALLQDFKKKDVEFKVYKHYEDIDLSVPTLYICVGADMTFEMTATQIGTIPDEVEVERVVVLTEDFFFWKQTEMVKAIAREAVKKCDYPFFNEETSDRQFKQIADAIFGAIVQWSKVSVSMAVMWDTCMQTMVDSEECFDDLFEMLCLWLTEHLFVTDTAFSIEDIRINISTSGTEEGGTLEEWALGLAEGVHQSLDYVQFSRI